ncbi:MAG: N2,N2-dimethylguanosine tRNA methyltransferase [Methanomassiliicoccales archaeon]
MRRVPGSKEIVEGTTRLLVPQDHSLRGPGKKEGVFYNAQMNFNRDVSVMLFRAIRPGGTALDSMAGTGARGVRICNEAPGDYEMVVNDVYPLAHPYIEGNLALNGLRDARPSRENMHCLLAERPFDYVDVDPFGSPVPFLDSALRGCKRNGMLALTATDTAPLSGTYPRKCQRRYRSRPLRCPFGHEVGLRILIGFVAREAGKYDRGIRPLLCFYADHYFRLHLRVEEGANRADRALSHITSMSYSPTTGTRGLGDRGECGPLWGGPLMDREVVEGLRPTDDLACPGKAGRTVSTWKEELDSPLFYESDEMASLLKGSPPPMNQILEALRKHGRASRTHFSPTGFKTDLPSKEVISILSDLMRDEQFM